MKRNKAKARAMRSGVPPYTRASRSGYPKRPCQHCQSITKQLKARVRGQDYVEEPNVAQRR